MNKKINGSVLKIVKKALADWKKTNSFEDARDVIMFAAIEAQASKTSMKDAKLITLIDEFGAKAMKEGSTELEKFYATLGANLVDSLLSKKANWLFDMPLGPMYEVVKNRIQPMSPQGREKAFAALREVINQEQQMGRQSLEKADLVRRVIKQVENSL